MRQLVYKIKNYLVNIFIILKSGIIYTAQQELAYWSNNWGNLVSTVVYILTYILFIDIIYANVNTIAGYNRNEMLFFSFIGQFWFYLAFAIFSKNYQKLVMAINSGELDLILTKPLPSLFYVSFRNIPIISILRDGIPPLIVLAIAIDWTVFSFSFVPVIAGIVLIFLGTICTNVLQFLAVLPAFWMGESTNILAMESELEHNLGHLFPYEGWNNFMQTVLTTILPVAIASGLATSVILQKTSIFPMLGIVFGISVIFIIIKQFAWNFALKYYTSASS